MLDVQALTCERGDRILFEGLSLTLEPGSLLYVEGRNGSGKTTLLRSLCGLFLPSAGTIRWRGEDIRRLGEEYRRELLYLGHHNGIKLALTPQENLRVATRLDGDTADAAAIDTALARIGLRGFEDIPARMLSQGQKRRVALARLLLTRAPLWVLDEPFTALDVAAVEQLQEIIAGHVAGGGLVVLTTHQEVALTGGRIQHIVLEG